MNLPAILTTPISRIDVANAVTYLQWLKASRYSYHIDDNPADVLWSFAITPTEVEAISARTSEAFHVLGYVGAWNIYGANAEDSRTIGQATFTRQETGGGCDALFHCLSDAFELIVTTEDGPSAPSADYAGPVVLGLYSRNHSDAIAQSRHESLAKLAEYLS